MTRPSTLGSGRLPQQNALTLGTEEAIAVIVRRLGLCWGRRVVGIDDRGAIRIRPAGYKPVREWPARWFVGSYNQHTPAESVAEDVRLRIKELAALGHVVRSKG
jgi:hypothetical protein